MLEKVRRRSYWNPAPAEGAFGAGVTSVALESSLIMVSPFRSAGTQSEQACDPGTSCRSARCRCTSPSAARPSTARSSSTSKSGPRKPSAKVVRNRFASLVHLNEMYEGSQVVRFTLAELMSDFSGWFGFHVWKPSFSITTLAM